MLFSFATSAIAAQLLLSAQPLAAANVRRQSSNSTCDLLAQAFPETVFYPGDANYTTLNEDFFSAAEWLGPACVVAPVDSDAMAQAVSTLVQSGVPFAIRGGGHMPIAGAANINSSGILLASAGLTQLQLSQDQSTVLVGAGNQWGAVYEYLAPYNLTVVGARMGMVGVPGFLLGGGMSFFSNEYGWASANIASYECVLADGTVVNATASNDYADLFWALRGGGNSFAIITSFTLDTLASPSVMVGQADYGYGVADAFLDSVYGFALDGVLDAQAFLTPTVNWLPSQSADPYYTSMLFYNGDDAAPAALANFTGSAAVATGNSTGLVPETNTFAYRTMADWSSETEDGFSAVHGMRFRFHVLAITAHREAMGLIHDTVLDLAAQRVANVSDMMITLAFNAIADSYIEGGRGSLITGDPMGIDATGAPYLWIEESLMYESADDDATIDAFLVELNDLLATQLAPLNVTRPFIPMNNADKDQAVFAGYAAENVATMKLVREKYDPQAVYTNQMPGGFKVAAA